MKTKSSFARTTWRNTVPGHLRTTCATCLLPLLLFALSSVVHAQDYIYTTNNGTITITGYTGSGGVVIIPSMINALPVTSIGNVAFAGCRSLTNVTIPNGVTSIGFSAFSDCLGLTNVAIPESVTSIGSSAFTRCWNLVNVKIPNGVNNIASDVFYDCTGLITVTIGNSVTNIGASAFELCVLLKRIYFMGNAPSLGFRAFYGDSYARVYYLPGTTGWSNTFDGLPLPTLLWNLQMQTGGANFGVLSNRFGFNITGNPGLIAVVEACTNLANAMWSRVGTNTLTNGSSYFGDPQWTNYPGRFYRLRSL